MSDKLDKTTANDEAVIAEATVAEEPLKAVFPANTTLSGTTLPQAIWYNVWLPQTFTGTVSGGVAQPTLSGNGWAGQTNTGFVFQNDQYNTTVRGF